MRSSWRISEKHTKGCSLDAAFSYLAAALFSLCKDLMQANSIVLSFLCRLTPRDTSSTKSLRHHWLCACVPMIHSHRVRNWTSMKFRPASPYSEILNYIRLLIPDWSRCLLKSVFPSISHV